MDVMKKQVNLFGALRNRFNGDLELYRPILARMSMGFAEFYSAK